MSRKPFSVITLALIGILTLIVLSSFLLNAQSEKWVPYVPQARRVELDYWQKNSRLYVNVSIMFSDAGYSVSNWGTPTIVGDNISANAEIWRWTGLSAQVITYQWHTYSLSNLSETDYSFIFKVWGSPVKDTTLILPEFFSFLFLSLFMMTTLLVVVIYKAKSGSS